MDNPVKEELPILVVFIVNKEAVVPEVDVDVDVILADRLENEEADVPEVDEDVDAIFADRLENEEAGEVDVDVNVILADRLENEEAAFPEIDVDVDAILADGLGGSKPVNIVSDLDFEDIEEAPTSKTLLLSNCSNFYFSEQRLKKEIEAINSKGCVDKVLKSEISQTALFFLMDQASKATEIGLVFDGKKLDI